MTPTWIVLVTLDDVVRRACHVSGYTPLRDLRDAVAPHKGWSLTVFPVAEKELTNSTDLTAWFKSPDMLVLDDDDDEDSTTELLVRGGRISDYID